MDSLQAAGVILAVSGLIVLFGISSVFTPPVVSMSEIDDRFLGEVVQVDARVAQASVHEGTTFLTLEEDGTRLDGVSFEKIHVSDGDVYTFTGRVNLYRGEIELIVHDVVPREGE